MIKKVLNSGQLSFLLPALGDQLDKTHGFYRLAQVIRWESFEKEFSPLYRADFGRPAIPIRRMVSLLIIKHLRNISDESVVEQWSENNYYQYLSGEKEFKPTKPCTAPELATFRKRIGEKGMEKILAESIRINGKDSDEDQIIGDTTVQEKNITFPTDSKLHIKIIDKCRTISEKEELTLRQSYRRTVPKLRYQQRGRNHPKHRKKAKKADAKIKTIAGRLVRELERKLPPNHHYNQELTLYKRVLAQKKEDSDKIYSLHEPNVKCISKGKDHKKYEFGNKVSILRTKNSGVIVGAMSFDTNIYDGHTLEPALQQYERLNGKQPKKVILDLGYRGKMQIGETQIITPDSFKKIKTKYQKQKHKKDMCRRSSIEPILGHIKQDHRLGRNYLKGIPGDHINVLLAAAAFNFKRFIRLKLRTLLRRFYYALWCMTEGWKQLPQPVLIQPASTPWKIRLF